ncbi:glycosyltransferase family 2 protein [Flavobacterium sp.]|uniref:glycosyltransferase family 2 protein n=1 Tax=Flavobacterium sp. TaxID=239 RepID=UPI0038FC9139
MYNNDSKNILDTKSWPWNFTSDDVNQDENKQLPKITIVTPSYNQADFLEETILSIINQKYPNLEYIIIDGGSTDNSVEIIKKYEKHIDYWVSEKDYGQSHALNKGFSRATGDILNWINSDDVLCENALKTIADAYLKRTSDNIVIVGNGYDMNGDSKIIGNRMVYNCDNKAENNFIKFIGNPTQQSIFFSKKIYQEAGGINPMIRYPMDIDLYYKFGYFKPEVIIIKEFLSAFRKHDQSKTISQDYKMLIEKLNLMKYLSFYDNNKMHYKNNISSYITSFSFRGISFYEKIKLLVIFVLNTNFNMKTKYKYRIVFEKIFLNKI